MGTTLKKKEEVKKPVRASRKVAPKTPLKRATVEKEKTVDTAKEVKKKTPKKDSPTRAKTVSPDNETVFVPSTASLRLLEKMQLYTLWYQKQLPEYMATAARVGGYAFITVGALLSSYAYVFDKGFFTDQSAALVCSQNVCIDVADSALPAAAPTISFLNSIPARVESDIDFTVSLSNTNHADVSLKALATGETISLTPIEQKSEHEQTFLIPIKNLKPGMYTVHAKTTDETKTYIFTGPTFIRPESELDVVVENTVSPSETLVAETLEATTTESVAVAAADEDLASSTEILPEPEPEPLPEIETEVVEEEATVPSAPINITLLRERGSAYVRVETGTFTPESVEVYSTPTDSVTPLFLGQATFAQGEWILSLEALELPAVEYLIYASFVMSDKAYQTEGVLYRPSGPAANESFSSADVNILVQKIELALLASEITNENRVAYYTYLTNQAQDPFGVIGEDTFADATVSAALDTVLDDYAPTLNALLLRYAVAVQGGQNYLISRAEKLLEDDYKQLASVVAAELADKTMVPTIHTALAQRYHILKDAIKNAEEQIKQDTNNLTSRDSDGDGISDFDEVALFNANPASADTDRDSVLDGVEIITGTPVLEPAVLLQKNSFSVIEDITYDEVVKLSGVSPLSFTALQGASEATYMVVEGTAVPYGYVYVNSPSVGVTGIIRANSAGAFTYTVEKDITNGKHEVRAVLLSATGEVIASSRPYLFEKTDTKFLTAAAINSVNDITPESSEKSITLYVLVAAVGVVTFGFILLMLGATLRNRKGKASPAL